MKQEASNRAEKFVVRFPAGMRDGIAEAAGDNHRSMNAEIVARLQHSMSNWPAALPAGRDPVPADMQEHFLLQRFRGLPAAKRQALLALLD